MENTPAEAICTPRRERFPEGNLMGRGVQIAEGAYFPIHPDSRQCIAILFSRAGVYWKINIPNSWAVLTVHNINTLPFFKQEQIVLERSGRFRSWVIRVTGLTDDHL